MKTIHLQNEGERGENNNPAQDQNVVKTDVDELEENYMNNNLNSKMTKSISKFNSLAFGNFRSFMPLPRKEDFLYNK